ncbi:MAG: two pore domain potassium channel family protein [Candidatus Latescibacteria bacterium]|nr:two pore domain potassium channel family protein [Candidatus Latescibacterota bacterium]
MKKNILGTLRVQIVAAVSAVAGLIALGTVVYHFLEGWTWIQSFYFSVVSLTTVGYGDLYPTTDPSRLFTALYILVGAGIVLASLGVIGANYLRRREKKILERRKKRRELKQDR